MKLAFSTLGVPALPVDQVARLAADHGFHGVELHAYPPGEAVRPGLGPTDRAAVAAEFQAAGVDVIGIATQIEVAAPGSDAPVLDALRAHLDLAADLGAHAVRVVTDGGGLPSADADVLAARRLAAGAPYATDLGVQLLLETHGTHRTAADAARVLGLVGHRNVDAVWNVMETWLGGEQPSASYSALAPQLAWVRVKDIPQRGDTRPLPLGQGVLPLAECVEVLSREGWEGWLCWEYEKVGYPQAPELRELLDAGRGHLLGLLDESA